MTKKELFKYGIKTDEDRCFCEENDLIDHTFIPCSVTKWHIQKSFGGLMPSTIHRSLQLWRNYDYVNVVHATKKRY